MKKTNLIFLLLLMVCFAGKGYSQTEPCGTTKVNNDYKAHYPQISDFERQLAEQTLRYYQNHPAELLSSARVTATGDTQYYDIPVVVHVMHDYGPESNHLTDNAIYTMISNMNKVYAGTNADLASVIPPMQRYIGRSTIRFHLATVDPYGNPTHGITHRRTYLTYGGDDEAKMDQWSPSSYYNIWFENFIGRGVSGGIVLAYAVFPSSAAGFPDPDGVIARFDADNDATLTIEHETGHYLNLLHVWNNNGSGGGEVGVACGDDNVDDTPPTKGHFSTCPLYDTTCSINNYKIYSDITGHDSLVNYPDTNNVQNIMDYSSCIDNFTKGQVERMYAALNSNVGHRNNLWDPGNLHATGVTDASNNFIPRIDLKPIPEFSAYKSLSGNYMDRGQYFTMPGISVHFQSKSWNDTITAVNWTFTNNAALPTSTATLAFTNFFSQPGWVDITMKVTGNHTSAPGVAWDSTVVFKNAIFVADSIGVNPLTYVQNWQPGEEAKWPFFNYYNNEFHWQIDSTHGYDDHYCIKYTGFDTRLNPASFVFPHTGSPSGDFDDLFSVPVDLSTFTDTCNLDFYTSAASRSSSSLDVNDSLEITYSVNGGVSWTKLTTLGKSSLVNKGALATEYFPSGMGDWAARTVGIPAAARTALTVFRFRYKPGEANLPDPFYGQPYSSGNDFYMDKIHFGRAPAGVEAVKLGDAQVVVVPNPTSGDAYVVVKAASTETAKVIVTDLTGKVVYTTNEHMTGSEVSILIPHTAISVTGMYLVTVTTGSQSQTKKLVVY